MVPSTRIPLFRPSNQLSRSETHLKNPLQVAQHSFYPFVEFTINTFKVKRNKITDKVEPS